MKRKSEHLTLWLGMILLILFFSSGSEAGPQPQILGAVTLLEIKPRIVTPNDDGKNDKIFFVFNNDMTGIPFETDVFDINGAKSGSLTIDVIDPLNLTWDGKDESGNVVPAGIYIYSIKIGKNLATGTVVVAR